MAFSIASTQATTALLDAVCRAVPYTTLIFDPSERCTKASAGSEPACDPKDVWGCKLGDLSFLFSAQAMECIRRARTEAIACSFENDDGVRWYELHAEPAGEGWIIAALRETTEKRRTHITLDRRMRELQKQLATNAELVHAQKEQLLLIHRQHEQIAALSAPLLEVADRVLALPFVGALDETRMRIATEQVLAAVVARRCQYVIVDLTGVAEMSTAEAAALLGLAQAIQLLGARSILSGFSPTLARALTALLTRRPALVIFANIREALGYCLRNQR